MPGEVIDLGLDCMPVRFKTAVGVPRVTPFALERVIVAVLGAAGVPQWLLPESNSGAAKSNRDIIARKPPPNAPS